MSAAIVEQERPLMDVERTITALDSRLDSLRTRRKKTEAELERLSRQEARLIRSFADEIGKEKQNLRKHIDAGADQRINLERELKGLIATISEAEEEREALLPTFESECKRRMETERRNKLEELRVAHNKNLERVRQADRALLAAQKAADKSFFALTAFRDQQA